MKKKRWIAVLIAATLAMNTVPGTTVAAWATAAGETDTDSAAAEAETEAEGSGEISEATGETVSEEAYEASESDESVVSGTEAVISDESILTTSGTETDESESGEAATEIDEAEIAAAAEERETSAEELGYVPGEILVVYKNEVAEETVAEVAEELDGELVETISDTGEENIAVVSISDDTTVETAVEQYLEDPAIEIAEPNYVLELMDDEEATLEMMSEYDSDSDTLWHLGYVNASAAWSSLATYVSSLSSAPSAVKVAVIDTGAYLSHEDLSDVINTELSVEVYGSSSSGWSYKTLRGDGYVNGTSTNDGSTHGTHVSGIIAAQSNNGVGIQGTGSDGTTSLANSIIDLVVIDAFEQKSNASVASVVYAMNYAYYTAECTIMNLSLGTTETSSVLEAKCNELYAAGVTIVCAAGNEGSTAAVYPADYSSTISVINITSSGTKSDSSSYGDEDISAPGTSIYSTKNGGSYVEMTGTSMAAPIVTAAAAILTYVDASLTPSEIKSVLCSTATDLNTSGYDESTAYGAVNIAAAVAAVLGEDTTYDIAYATVSGISSSYTATGSAITPTPTVKCYGVTLTKGTDYTLSYSNNTAPGTATITITGIGNYTGTKQVTFTIVKASQTLSVSASSTSIYTYATSTITASGTGTITYSSSNTSVATVSSSGVVTGKAAGTVTITVTAAGNTYYNSATKTVSITVKSGTTVYNGVDYSAVYDYGYYINKYSDLKAAFGSNETAALKHFITYGMSEGRQASESFDVYSYAYKYADLRNAYKNNLPSYYTHYMKYGKAEGRTATGTTTMQNCVTTYNGVDYSSVYNGTYYISKYSDIKNAYGLDDEAILQHFVKYGMAEGRQAISTFNVYSYAYKYADLRSAYKNNLSSYYTHYMKYGKAEGRTATGTTTMQNCVTTYNGVDYSSVYNGTYYISKYSDIKNAFGLDDEAILQHFVKYGMSEGRQAIASFNVSVYRNRYADLRTAFGSDLKSYYMHYIYYGKAEGRTAV